MPITKFMDADHAYLDYLWADFIGEKEDIARMTKCLEVFEEHLLLHMRLEDKYLFKRLDDYIGINENSGLTSSAIEDHKVIIKLLKFTKESVRTGKKREIAKSANHLNRALSKHKERELKLQYPVSEAFINPKEWSQILLDIYGEDLLSKIKKRINKSI